MLIKGDGDFIPLIEYLKEGQFGIQVEVMAFGRSASSKLREVADEFINLEDESAKYLLKTRSRSGS